MITTNKTGISEFIQSCIDNGLHHVVCSPGSRNAPLVISFDEHPDIETYVIHDERSAGFYALGLAQELDCPVAVVCTSGSAVLNYYPAVAEAFYQSVPLVVISADRPEEWVDHGDGQTIRQEQVLKNHVKGFYSVNEFCNSNEEHAKLRNGINDMFELCNGLWKGPVHFNCPLTEPLYGTVDIDIKQNHRTRNIEITRLTVDQQKLISDTWSSCKRKLILCGQMKPDKKLTLELSQLCNDSSVAVLVENTSNQVDRRFIHCIDRTLATISPDEIKDFQPELLITLGDAVISKRIKKFLRDSDVKAHWKIGFSFPEMDTYRHLSETFKVLPVDFIRELNSFSDKPAPSNFGSKWKQKDLMASDKIPRIMEKMPYSDLKVFDLLLDYIPEESYLHMSNSSVVRYCQLFNPVSSINYFANRGTSGIDGSTSTACGVALASPGKLNVLITGDVSFFYDSNALWSKYLGDNLRIVMINNGGGGIFRIIDGPSSSNQLEKYFEARHSHSAEHICKAFNVNYSSVSNMTDIEKELQQFFLKDDNGPKLLEINTSAEDNDQVLKDFFKLLN